MKVERRAVTSMQSASNPSEFLSAPIGRYLSGASFVVWAQNAKRIGMFHIGPLDPADQETLRQIASLPPGKHLAQRSDLLYDISSMNLFDENSFAFFEKFLATYVDGLASRVNRLAVVRPAGLAGAALTGLFHHWVVPRFEAKLCTTRSEAYDFMDVSGPDRGMLNSLSDLGSLTMRRFRDALVRDVGDASLSRAAASVSMSSRSLQRLLATHKTTFRRELAKARIRVAETILVDRDDKLETIARELGFSSASNFSTMFARATGRAPSAFRACYRIAR